VAVKHILATSALLQGREGDGCKREGTSLFTKKELQIFSVLAIYLFILLYVSTKLY